MNNLAPNEKVVPTLLQEVFNVLIHLLSLIFLKMASSLQHLSIIMTDKLATLWPSLVKWAATGDSSK